MSNYELIETDERADQGMDPRRGDRGRRADAAGEHRRGCRSSSVTSRSCRTSTSGIGATVGSVVPTRGRDHPGGGRRRHRLRHDGGADRSLDASSCPDSLKPLRTAIEKAVPHGRTANGGARRSRRVARRPAGAGQGVGEARARVQADRREAPASSARATTSTTSARSAPATTSSRSASTRRSTCGSCCTPARAASATGSAPTSSSSRSATCAATRPTCPTRTSRTCARAPVHFADYVAGGRLGAALRDDQPRADDGGGDRAPRARSCRRSRSASMAVNCHHNYVAREHHFGTDVFVTRKGAVRARRRRPRASSRARWARAASSSAARASRRAFHSCSHGAGRAMSRGEAKRRFTVDDHVEGDRGHRVPQGRRRDRRDADGLQADRQGDGGAGATSSRSCTRCGRSCA